MDGVTTMLDTEARAVESTNGTAERDGKAW